MLHMAAQYLVVCVNLKQDHTVQRRSCGRVPGGARLHDYWQQASKRGTRHHTTKEVRELRVETGRSSDTRNSGAFTALRCEARTQPRRGGRLSFSFTL
jgi:hypothetical protein